MRLTWKQVREWRVCPQDRLDLLPGVIHYGLRFLIQVLSTVDSSAQNSTLTYNLEAFKDESDPVNFESFAQRHKQERRSRAGRLTAV